MLAKTIILSLTLMIGLSFAMPASAIAIVPEACRGDADIKKCNLSAVETAAVNVAKVLLGIAGGLALVMFVYGGFLYIFAGGSSKIAGKAKDTLVYATIGLVVVLSSGLILKSVVQALTGG